MKTVPTITSAQTESTNTINSFSRTGWSVGDFEPLDSAETANKSVAMKRYSRMTIAKHTKNELRHSWNFSVGSDLGQDQMTR
jgi:hypothetical protein